MPKIQFALGGDLVEYVVLRGVPMVNKHLVADKVIEHKVSALSVWTLWLDKKAINMASFHDKHLRLKPSPRVQAARNLKTLFTSHVFVPWKGWPNLKHALHKSSYEQVPTKLNASWEHN